jgi:hypothetical protein
LRSRGVGTAWAAGIVRRHVSFLTAGATVPDLAVLVGVVLDGMFALDRSTAGSPTGGNQ